MQTSCGQNPFRSTEYRSNGKESSRVLSGQAVRRWQHALCQVRHACRTTASIVSSERFLLNLIVLSSAARDNGCKQCWTVRPNASADDSLALLQ